MRLTCSKNGSYAVNAVAWSIDGKIASGSTDRTVMIWNSSTGERLKTLEGHSNSVSCLQFNPTGAGQLVTGSATSANDAFDPALWETFVSTTLGLEVPVLSSLPRLNNRPLAKCGCKKKLQCF